MKVAAICPGCSRPASSKGRTVCLYCGAPLQPVVTGQVSAAQSGVAIEVPPHLRREARETPPHVKVSLPELAPTSSSVWSELRQRPLLMALLWFLGVGAAIVFLGSFISREQSRYDGPVSSRPVR